ncbi:MAG TPA: S9 family peptidase [Cytophagaceae bacterium]|nr:S9 family peptidase [Cytophagaceae bacterium]
MYKNILFLLLPILPLSSNAQNLTLEDLWLNGKYRAEYTPFFNWTPDGQHYSDMDKNEKGLPSVHLYSIKGSEGGELTALMPQDLPDSVSFEDYILGPDQQTILFSSQEESIYRRSSKAYYYIFDTKTGTLAPLYELKKGKISYPEFSPDGKKIAYVRDNNLYITDISTHKEKILTSDGKFNFIINGACDWVYEEEFEFAKAFFWSPDSKRIAYYRFDESRVKEYNMQLWGNIYPTDYRYKYPKAGEDNSQVSLHCALLDENKTIDIDATLAGEREYFPRMRWTGIAHIVSYYRMNRLQNKLEIIHYDLSQKKSSTPYTETDSAYVEITDNHFYLNGTEDFIFTSEKNGFRHIYKYSQKENQVQPLTSGAYEVAELLGVDEKNKLVYFISQEDSPMEKHLYSIDLSGHKKKKLTKEKGVHSISFAPDFAHYTDTYASFDHPPVMLLRQTGENTLPKVMSSNASLREKLAQANLGKHEFFKFTTSQNTTLNGWMIKPANFSPAKHYPVLFTIYGGPGSQEVLDSWKGPNFIWYQLLAQKGYLVVCIDGRGTGGRGASFKKITQHNLGKYETEDLIEAAKYFRAQSYVDSSRIGIFGWSFGGYLSSLCITKGSNYFKTAVAVAPVTNWRYYDNIYTERFMGLPKDNSKGYDENAPAYFADLLKGNYLLIHGTADDNVHIQNAIEMQRALIKANKQFETFYYPDKNHSLYGGNTRYHLYKMITDYLLKNL